VLFGNIEGMVPYLIHCTGGWGVHGEQVGVQIIGEVAASYSIL